MLKTTLTPYTPDTNCLRCGGRSHNLYYTDEQRAAIAEAEWCTCFDGTHQPLNKVLLAQCVSCGRENTEPSDLCECGEWFMPFDASLEFLKDEGEMTAVWIVPQYIPVSEGATSSPAEDKPFYKKQPPALLTAIAGFVVGVMWSALVTSADSGR
ncbi:MAG TPA: hypothetical protein VLL52_14880 [Anaerolineae bacterium]|nr:hypothetical protein [Anaerolineae bacterium]